jgi:hypothetical protein
LSTITIRDGITFSPIFGDKSIKKQNETKLFAFKLAKKVEQVKAEPHMRISVMIYLRRNKLMPSSKPNMRFLVCCTGWTWALSHVGRSKAGGRIRILRDNRATTLAIISVCCDTHPFTFHHSRNHLIMLKNDYLPFDQLPQAEHLPFESLPRSSIMCDVLLLLLFWALVIPCGVVLTLFWEEAAQVMKFARWWLPPLCLLSFGWPSLAWRYRRIALREHDVLLEEGVIWRSIRAQSLTRVQHVKLVQGPIQRWFGLATLVLYTAGRSRADFKLRHLPHSRAEQLRDYILHGPVAS